MTTTAATPARLNIGNLPSRLIVNLKTDHLKAGAMFGFNSMQGCPLAIALRGAYPPPEGFDWLVGEKRAYLKSYRVNYAGRMFYYKLDAPYTEEDYNSDQAAAASRPSGLTVRVITAQMDYDF